MGEMQIRQGKRYWVEDADTPAEKAVLVSWPNIRAKLIPWEALDDEEISNGRLKNADGRFAGGVPDLVPRDMMREMQSRLMDRVQRETLAAVMKAQAVVVAIAEDDTVPAGDRLRAATHIWDRFAGKVADKVEITAEIKPWENLLSGITVEEDGDGSDQPDRATER